MRSRIALPALALAVSALAPAEAQAAEICGAGGIATRTWDGGASTLSWHDDANWSGDVEPSAGDHVCLEGASGTVQFDTGTSDIASLEATSALKVRGGTLNLTDAAQDSSAGSLTLGLFGSLGGAGDLTVANFLYGGHHSAPSNATTTTVTNSLTWTHVDFPGGPTLSSRTLVIAPGATATGAGTLIGSVDSNLTMSGTNPRIEVRSGGTLRLVEHSSILGSGTIQNDGTIRRVASADNQVSEVRPQLTNNGSVVVERGQLNLVGGSTTDADGASYQLGNASTLSFSGTHQLGASSFTDGADSATLHVDGGTSTLAASGSLDVNSVRVRSGTLNVEGAEAIPSLTIGTFGSLGGAGDLTVANFLYGGHHSAPSNTTTTTVTNSLTWTPVGFPGDSTLSSRTLVVASGASATVDTVLTMAGTNPRIEVRSGASLRLGDSSAIIGSGTIQNDGTIRKVASADNQFSELRPQLINNGSLIAERGSLFPSGSLTNSGTIDVRAGARISTGPITNLSGTTLTGGTYLVSGTFHFQNANVVTNAAEIVLDGAGAQFLDQSSQNGLRNLATNAAAGKLTIRNGKNLTTPGALASGGTLTVGDSSTLTLGSSSSTLTNTGTLKGTGTIAGNVTSSGVLAPGLSPGILTVNGNYTQQAGGVLRSEIAGASAGSGYDRLTVTGSASLDGTLDIQTDPGFSPATGDRFQILDHGSRTGEFATLSGDLLTGGNRYTPEYSLSNTALVVGQTCGSGLATRIWDGGAGTSSWHDASNWAPNGLPGAADHACIPAGAGTVDFNSGDTPILSLEAESPLSLSGGSLNLTDAGRPSSLADLTLSSGTLTPGGQLTVGDLAWSGGVLGSASAASTTTLTGSAAMSGAGPKAIQGGVLEVSPSATATLSGGDLEMRADAIVSNAGVFEITGGSDIEVELPLLGGPQFVNGGTLRKAGPADVSSVSATLVNQGELAVASGTLEVIPDAEHFTQFLNSGVPEGRVEVEAWARFDIALENSAPGLPDRFLNYDDGIFNLGRWVLRGHLSFIGADIVENRAEIVLDGLGAISLNGPLSPSGLRNLAVNSGELTLQNGKGLGTAAALGNDGELTLGDSSGLALGGGAGGTLTNAGTLRGLGTVQGDVTSSGVVAPGLSPGRLTIDGNYNQQSGGSLRTEIAGTAPGTGHDQLAVTGSASLGGTLEILTGAGFTPTLGSSFEIESGQRAGQFATLAGASLPGGLAYDVQYDTDNVTLDVIDTAASLPTPPSLTATSPDSPANHNDPRVVGAAEPGTTIRLYATPNCSGPRVVSGIAAELASPGLAVAVADDSTSSFSAKARNTGGTSLCSAAITYVEDSTPPTTTITGPTATNDNTPTYNLSSEAGSTFECSLDGAAFAPCSGASSHTTAPVIDGEHTLRVRATDAASNVESPPASKAFTIDTRAPETEIDSGPRDEALLQRGSSHQVAFSASEPGAAFRCSLNDGFFVACTSPQALSTSTEGQFSLEVRATDAAGNVDSSPARLRYTVVSASCGGQAATILGTEGPDHITGTSGADVIVTFSGDDVIEAEGGSDRVCSGPGDDGLTDDGAAGVAATLNGGSGDDRFFLDATQLAATMTGGSGDDSFTVIDQQGATPVADTVNAGSGADTIQLGGGSDQIKAGDGDDEVRAGAGKDSLLGGSDDDDLRGEADADQVRGGEGDDALDGGSGADTCNQGSGSGPPPVSC